MIGIIIAEYKLEQIKAITKDKTIVLIIEYDIDNFTDTQLSQSSGLTKSVLTNLRRYHKEKDASFGFIYHSLTLKIELIAKTVED